MEGWQGRRAEGEEQINGYNDRVNWGLKAQREEEKDGERPVTPEYMMA